MKYAFFVILILSVFLVAGCSKTDTANTANNQVPANTANNQVPTNNQVSGNPSNTAADVPPLPPVPGQVQQQAKISSSELALHNTESDCWVAYEGKVYDVTSFLPVHPGGSTKIVPYCGTSGEFESAFLQKHGTSKVSVLEKQGIYKGVLG